MNHITASDVFRPPEKIADGISEYEREQQSFRANYERLRAERLAREADQDRQTSIRITSNFGRIAALH
jgi:hypothetical protein